MNDQPYSLELANLIQAATSFLVQAAISFWRKAAMSL
jgi:hypothetical protein